MTDYEEGDTIKFQAITKDFEGNIGDVDTITIEIYDEDGVLIVTATSMTKSVTGTYYYKFDSTDKSVGYYYYYVKTTYNSDKGKSKGTFILTDS